MTEAGPEPEGATGRIAALVEAWDNVERPFAERVRRVSQTFMECRLRAEQGATLLGTTVAELEAVLHLATMDEDDLRLVGIQVPPKTTWFGLSGASGDAVRAALDALSNRPSGSSPAATVRDAIELATPSVATRVAALPGDALGHMAKKAKDYDRLSPQARKFLVSAATMRRRGTALSAKQLAWLTDLLRELADQGAVKRQSPDGDQAFCDSVLDAIDR